MSLEDEMRAILDHEADARPVPSPDVTGLLLRGRARRRRRNVVRLGVGIVASAVVAATAFGVIDSDPRADEREVSSQPERTSASEAAPPPLAADDRAPLPPGTYRVFVGRDAKAARISADVTVDGPNWKTGDFAVVSDRAGGTFAGFGVYQPKALAAGTGCVDDVTTSDVGNTPARVAEQLAGLPRGTVLREPSQTQVAGLTAIHLRLRLDVTCPGYYRVAHAAAGTRGITYTPNALTAVNVVIDFWVLEVGDVPVVIDQWHNLDAPSDLVDRAQEARTSITFVESDQAQLP